MRGPPPRTWTALAVSTSLHVLVLGLLFSTVRASLTPSPLAVHLVSLPPLSPAGPLEASVEVEGAAAFPRPLASATLPRASSPRRPPRDTTEAQEVASVTLGLATAASEAASFLGPAPSTETAFGPAEGPEASAFGLSGSPRAAAADGRLGELHRRLAEAAARCYPAAARRFRLTGEVPVRFCLDGRGTAKAVSLEGSTGSPLLDRSALECVVQGAEPLSGFEGCFLVPVRFGG